MKQMLLALAPWMAMIAAAQDSGPVSVAYTHYGTFERGLTRVKDDVLATETALEQWGWKVDLHRNDATVSAESRRLQVPLIQVDGTALISLKDCLKQLGANGEWIDGTNQFVVTAAVRNITLANGKLSLDTTLDVWPKLGRLSNPSRLVIDLEGASYSSGNPYRFELPQGVRIAQYRRNTFRIVIEDPKTASAPEPRLTPGRSFDIDLRPLGVANNPTTIITRDAQPVKPVEDGSSSATDKPAESAVSGFPGVLPKNDPKPPVKSNDPVVNPDSFDPNGKQAAIPMPVVQPVTISKPRLVPQKSGDLLVVFPISRRLQNPASSKYADLTQIEILVPNSVPGSPVMSRNLAESLKGLELSAAGVSDSRISLTTSRPMGVRVSNTATELSILLVRPKVSNSRLAGKTIVVDAGHGGTDSGAVSPDGKVYEKNITLKVAKFLAEELTDEGAQAVMTRIDDVKIALGERSAIANRLTADLFISIHVNSNKVNNSRSGCYIFHHKQDPLGILLAECIAREIAKVSNLPNLGAISDGRIYSSGFAVLRNSTMPGVLCELGFINHSTDRARLIQEEYQTAVAKAIVKGIKVYLGDAQSN
ncbi:MAG: N-acetylmuramoyl-L-alanine amidase [Chthonomonas sp.]|nr:N-acetylmuramoyl-L-alanine amidase [Chthonomonas sp.]